MFSIDLRVRVPEYEVDNRIFDRHVEGSYLYREVLILSVGQKDGKWRVRYGLDSRTPGRPGRTKAEREDRPDGVVFKIPVRSSTKPGLDATLELKARRWE